MKSRFLAFVLIPLCLAFISNIYAQSCATVYVNDDNLPSLPDDLCIGDELALCFDLDVDEATFDASLVEFNYELMIGGASSEVELQSVYNSGTAIDENASGQICFKAAIPSGPTACEGYELSLEIKSVFYNDPACTTNFIAYELNLTDPIPLMLSGENLSDLIPLLAVAGLNPILVNVANCSAGCTDAMACNFNPDACEDDGSCLSNDCNGDCGGEAGPGSACDDGDTLTENDVYGEDCSCSGTAVEIIEGCTNSDACNYNPDATAEDDTCLFNDCMGACGGEAIAGSACDDGNADTENDVYGEDCTCSGTAVSETPGCTDADACNYNPDATLEDDTCLYNDCMGACGGEAIAGTACDDGNADTENDVYGEDCTCSGTPIGGVLGCTDPDYCNYDPDATVEDGSCISEDCAGVCGGTTLPGSNCDDFDVETINEAFNSDCECVGERIENFCELDALDITYACESEEKTTVVISFEGEGTYTMTDGLATYTDVQSGTYSYDDYPTHSGYELVLTQTEGNDVGCMIIKKFNTPRCFPCNSDAGLIGIDDYTQPEINVCEGDILQLRHTDTVLGRYQSIFFIIHSAGPDISADDLPLSDDVIFDYTRDIRNTAELSGNYWATAIVATTVQPGVPDLEDQCLVVSNTVKINLLEPLEIIHTATCDEEEEAYQFTLEVEGGLPELDNSSQYTISSNYFNGMLDLGETYTSDLLPNGAMYSISVTDNNGCKVKSDLFIVDCADPLPIELISFSGEALPTGNLLKWVTASEINNDFFTIQSSRNGIDYQEIAVMEGSGTNSNTSDYQYLHRAANGGTTYYKLIQTDFDGTTVEVANAEITRSEKTEFNVISVLPVPAINNLEITLQSTDEQTVFEVFDVIGRPVLKEIYESKVGLELYKLNVKDLSSGVYFISITNNNKAITKRFIKD